jgi:hypothetical protein
MMSYTDLILKQIGNRSLYIGNFTAKGRITNIHSAVRFLLPEGGHVLTATYTPVKELHLPFPDVALEFDQSVDGGLFKTTLILRELDDVGITVEAYNADQSGEVWGLFPVSYVIESNANIRNVINDKDDILLLEQAMGTQMLKASMVRSEREISSVVVNFITALSMPGVERIETVTKVDPRINAKRLKKGKTILPDSRIITLKLPREIPTKNAPGGGHHASPKAHTRMGHPRHYKNGKVIWIKPIEVKGEGHINKTYKVVT